MQIREYSLPQGWFPHDPKELSWAISGFLEGYSSDTSYCACIAPHAGWYYSGRLAALSISGLDKDAKTIAVIGGHLTCEFPSLFAMEDSVKTPLGLMPIDKELRSALIKDMNEMGYNTAPDRYKDNTVEVLLPMVKYFIPKASLLWLRLPPYADSCKIGRILSKTAKKLGKKIGVIGSTDLTHYGRNYGYSPQGAGEAALRWVREVNDAAFINAVKTGNVEEVLRRAEQDMSSCSAGAVLGAMGFAKAEGAVQAQLIEYGTSADVEKGAVPDSFVGYAAMRFEPAEANKEN